MKKSVKIHKIEKGRSMVEMLGVLAIGGVLAVFSIPVIRTLMEKRVANTIVNDSRIAYADISSNQSVLDTDWHNVSEPMESNKTFQVMRDKKKNNYVKVMGVEKEVCKKILSMTTENVLAFFKEDYTDMTTCEDDNNIVIAWYLGAPAECETVSDCGEGFAGSCDENGRCQGCDPATERLNKDGTACECDPEKAASCYDGKNTWCCGDGMSCDILNKTCVNGGGACMYNFAISMQNQANVANCHYRVTDIDNGDNFHSITMTLVESGCAADEYCYVRYFDKNCASSINRGDVGVSSTEDVYGVCIERTSNSVSCEAFPIELPEQQEILGCPAGQYCYIKWEGNDCSTAISRGDVVGSMFGSCINQSSNTVNQCPIEN